MSKHLLLPQLSPLEEFSNQLSNNETNHFQAKNIPAQELSLGQQLRYQGYRLQITKVTLVKDQVIVELDGGGDYNLKIPMNRQVPVLELIEVEGYKWHALKACQVQAGDIIRRGDEFVNVDESSTKESSNTASIQQIRLDGFHLCYSTDAWLQVLR